MTTLNSLVVSAPAKVILHGEHAVVYGKVALAASLGLRTTLTWERSTEDAVELQLIDLGFNYSWVIAQLEQLPSFSRGDLRSVEVISSESIDAFKAFLYDNESGMSEISSTAALTFLCLYKVIYGKTGSLLPGKFIVKSEVPVGAGLGSSASYSVVVAAGLLLTSGALSPESISPASLGSASHTRMDYLRLVNQWAYEGEKLMHGNPSGIDNTMSTFGGFLQFQSGKMENIERVPELSILLVNTNIPRSTKAMVTGLRQRYQEMPGIYELLFTAMGAIAVECVQVLGQMDKMKQDLASSAGDKEDAYFQKLEKLIDLNQNLLKTVGVSHSTVDKVCEKTLEYQLHSKLTGAGGGGCLVTLINEAVASETMDGLCEELKNLGCTLWKTRLGGRGVLVHSWS